jgi:hypothetical protein
MSPLVHSHICNVVWRIYNNVVCAGAPDDVSSPLPMLLFPVNVCMYCIYVCTLYSSSSCSCKSDLISGGALYIMHVTDAVFFPSLPLAVLLLRGRITFNGEFMSHGNPRRINSHVAQTPPRGFPRFGHIMFSLRCH